MRPAVWADLSLWPPDELPPCSIVLKRIEERLRASNAAMARTFVADAASIHCLPRSELVHYLDQRADPFWMAARAYNRGQARRLEDHINAELDRMHL